MTGGQLHLTLIKFIIKVNSWRFYNRQEEVLNQKSPKVIDLACENIRFSSLFAAGDVSRGGTSATQRQKFHTDDVKSVRNPVRSTDWSTQ